MSLKVKPPKHPAELACVALLAAIGTLLSANIIVMLIAAHYNDLLCRTTTIAAASAAVQGIDTKGVYLSACKEIGISGFGSWFITDPKLCKFSDTTQNNIRKITVCTECTARLPAKRLLVTNDLAQALTLKRIYAVEMSLRPY